MHSYIYPPAPSPAAGERKHITTGHRFIYRGIAIPSSKKMCRLTEGCIALIISYCANSRIIRFDIIEPFFSRVNGQCNEGCCADQRYSFPVGQCGCSIYNTSGIGSSEKFVMYLDLLCDTTWSLLLLLSWDSATVRVCSTLYRTGQDNQCASTETGAFQ